MDDTPHSAAVAELGGVDFNSASVRKTNLYILSTFAIFALTQESKRKINPPSQV